MEIKDIQTTLKPANKKEKQRKQQYYCYATTLKN